MNFFAVGFVTFLATTRAAAAAPDLRISIDGVKPNKGPVVVSIFKDEDVWLKAGRAVQRQKLPPDQVKVSTHFNLPPGTYAVSIFQDENDNDKLDMQWLPPGPAEPWVVSNNAQGSMGPPSFKDAKFAFSGDLALSLTLQQP